MVDHTPQPDAASAARLANHATAKDALAQVDDESLRALVADSAASGPKYGTVRLPAGGVVVFAKLLPLSDIEAATPQRLATNNVFDVPCHYQYRLGSLGFGAWRELAAQRLATEWALAGTFSAVPLLHGWRVLPITSAIRDDRAKAATWLRDPKITDRIAANLSSTLSLVLFMEPYPQTFAAWLGERLAGPDGPAVRPQELEASLLAILRAVNTRGMLHMDAHLENFLTDGEVVVLGDYGLASAGSFDLSPAERRFLERHESFDRCTAISSLVQTLVAHYDPRPLWRDALKEMTTHTHASCAAMPAAILEYLTQRGPLARAMGTFYRQLKIDLSTDYPADALKKALDAN